MAKPNPYSDFSSVVEYYRQKYPTYAKLSKKYGEAVLDYYRTTGQLPPEESDINKTVTPEDKIRFIAKWERESLTQKPVEYTTSEPLVPKPGHAPALAQTRSYEDIKNKKHTRSVIELRSFPPKAKDFANYISTLSHELRHVPQQTRQIEQDEPNNSDVEHFGPGSAPRGKETSQWLYEQVQKKKQQYLKEAPGKKAQFIKYLEEVEGFPRENILDKPLKATRAKPTTRAIPQPEETWQGTPEEGLKSYKEELQKLINEYKSKKRMQP